MPRAAMPIGGRRPPPLSAFWLSSRSAAASPQTRPSATRRHLPATHSPHLRCSTPNMQAVSVPVRPGALLRARSSAPRASLRRAATLVRASADRQEAPQAQQVAATALLAAAGLLAPMVLDTEAAQAVPELLKGRTFSLIHPGACLVWVGALAAL